LKTAILRNTRLQAVNGHRLGCGHRLAWIVIRGKRLSRSRQLSAHAEEGS